MSNVESIRLIDGMTDTYANQLIAAGLDTYYEIYRLKLSTLQEKLNDPSLDADTAARWQKDAVKLDYTRSVAVTVLAKDGRAPVSGATVTAGDVSGVTDDQGMAILYRVRVDCTTIQVSAQGYMSLQSKTDLRVDKPYKINFSLAASNHEGQYVTFSSEYKGQYISVRSGDIQRMRTRELADLPSGAYLQAVRENADKGTVQLVSLYREKDGSTIYSDRVEQSNAQLPAGTAIGSIVLWEGGRLQPTSETRESVALALRETALGISRDKFFPKVIFNDSAEQRHAAIELPKIDLSRLSDAQKAVVNQLFEQNPEGIAYYQFKNTIAILEAMGGSADVI